MDTTELYEHLFVPYIKYLKDTMGYRLLFKNFKCFDFLLQISIIVLRALCTPFVCEVNYAIMLSAGVVAEPEKLVSYRLSPQTYTHSFAFLT